MSQPKTKEELTRLAWLAALRRQGHRKCEGTYHQGTNVCALGLLLEIAGFEEPIDISPTADYRTAGALAGLTDAQSFSVYKMNDGEGDHFVGGYHKHTFAEIADVVEGWFKD